MTVPHVYVAHPVVSYGTPEEARALARLAELLPGCELVDPAGMFADGKDWLRRWPKLLANLDGLVLVPAKDGTIGAGCWRELGDAWAARLPVAMLHRRQLCEAAAVKVATVEAGPRFPAGLFASLVEQAAEAAA